MAWPTFDKLDDIPEAFRDAYEEKDGKFVPIEGAGDGALKALDTERSARQQAEKDRKAAEQARKDLEAQLAETKQELQAKEAGKSTEELKALRETIRKDEAARALEWMKNEGWVSPEEAKRFTSEIRSMRLDSVVKQAMLDNGVRKERVDALFRLAGEEFDLADDDKPVLPKHPGKAVEIFVKDDLKKRYPEFFEGSKADGGGAGGLKGGLPQHGVTADDVVSNPTAARASARASA